ncbi:MAG TPA: hypothetical protein VHI13_22755 [Candidatus Kapabacteria bacterium]|nr:hypothetical protein [Candidatus Kapabacteria bacterium]
MVHEQQLHDLIDGSLEYGDEVALFSALNASEELRRELKMLLLMRQAVAHDSRAYTPAPQSQEAIFSRLGFTGAPTAPPEPILEPAPTPAPTPTGAGRFAGGSRQGIIGGIIGAFVMLLFLMSGDRRLPSSTERGGTDRTATADAVQRDGSGPAPGRLLMDAVAGTYRSGSDAVHLLPTAARFNGEAPAGMFASAERRRSSHAAVFERRERNGRHTAGAEDIRPAAFGIEKNQVAAIAPRSFAGPEGTMLRGDSNGDAALHEAHGRIAVNAPAPMPNDPRTQTPVITEFRAITDRNAIPPPATLGSASTSILRNRGVGIYYKLHDPQWVGAEVGAEEFYLRYRSTLQNGDLIQHEENPLLIWGGASFKQFLRVGPGLEPYVQATLGGTRIGPLGRATVGTYFTIAPELRLFAGLEAGMLAYRFDGVWYTAPKFGVSYGLSLRF